MASTRDPFHDRLLSIVLELPGAYEDRPWGSVHCKVDGKIFVGWGRVEDGDMSIGIRVDLPMQAMLVANDPRFSIAKYSGKYGGVDMRLGRTPNWREVESLIVQSYRLVAPKKRVKELDAMTGTRAAPAARKDPARKAVARKAVPKAKSRAAR